jgi:serine/threonine protein phosphatase PrpC
MGKLRRDKKKQKKLGITEPRPARKGFKKLIGRSAKFSDPGRVRKNNEDFILSDDIIGIYLLADGMGGHNAGEVASKLAVETAYACIVERLSPTGEDGITTMLSDAMMAAHDAVNAKAKTDLSLMGMGTTLIEVIFRGKKAFVCHAGDSRVYLYHDTLQRLTRDHTVGDQLLENNILPREKIPEKQFHTLTQAIGVGSPPVPDCKQVTLVPGDMLLLCSDGLTDMLSDAEIGALIASGNANLKNIAQGLFDAANANGGRDNISVVLIIR